MSNQIKFTGLVLDRNKIMGEMAAFQVPKVIPSTWIKLTVTLKNEVTIDSVLEWITENCSGDFSHYNYYRNNWTENILTLRFEDKNDAVAFKLAGIAESSNSD